MSSLTKGLFAGSFDPFTNGHLDIVRNAAEKLDSVIIGIANNADKNCILTVYERYIGINNAIKTFKLNNVSCVIIDGMLSDFAFRNDITLFIRGYRNEQDLSYEKTLAKVNKNFCTIETLFIESKKPEVSSSLVRSLLKEYWDISSYVTPYIKSQLEQKLWNVKLIGVTGGIASGKSTFCKDLEVLNYKTINMDKMVHEIYESREPYARKLVSEIIREFGIDPTIDRKKLGKLVFSDNTKLRKLNTILRPAIYNMLQRKVKELIINVKPTIIFIESATLAESIWLMNYVSNNVILAESKSKGEIFKRLIDIRDMDPIDAVNVYESQITDSIRKTIIKDKIKSDGYGTFTTIQEVLNGNERFNSGSSWPILPSSMNNIDLMNISTINNYVKRMKKRLSNEVLTTALIPYNDANRFYHTIAHIAYMLVNLKNEKNIDELIIAIIFHDYIQKDDSAELFSYYAAEDIVPAGYDMSIVRKLILATISHEKGDDPLVNEIIDLDLAIFKGSEKDYLMYKKNIRKEYLHIGKDSYNIKRLKILENLSKTIASDNIDKEIIELKEEIKDK